MRLIAHRFGRAYGPDNSRAALDHTLAGGPIHGLETDCCVTADGDIVLLHDPHLEKSTTGDGWAHEQRRDELSRIRLREQDGTPSDEGPLWLDELLEDRPPVELLQLEVKAVADERLAVRTAEVLCERLAGVDREGLEVISFWPGAVEVAARRGFATRLIIACAYLPGELAAWARSVGMTGVVLEGHYFAEPVVRTWRAAGLSITSGLVNEEWLLDLVLAHAPDAVCTDRPLELAAGRA
jgi:glycerophosphoryl diester phosphodiesterase